MGFPRNSGAGACPVALSLIFIGFPAPYTRAIPPTQTAPPYIHTPHTHPQLPCIPILSYWPHALRDRRGIAVGLHRWPPYTSVALRQFTKNCTVRNLTSRGPYTTAHASQIPMRLGSTYGPSPHTFYADPTYCPQAPKISTLVSIRPAFPAPQIPNQSGPTNSPTLGYTCTAIAGTAPYAYARKPTRRDQRPVYPDPRIKPVCSNSPNQRLGAWVWHRFAARRRRRSGGLRSSPPEGRRLRPKARIPGEPEQAGSGKSPQTRRRIRGTDDRSRRPPARPNSAKSRRGSAQSPQDTCYYRCRLFHSFHASLSFLRLSFLSLLIMSNFSLMSFTISKSIVFSMSVMT